MPARITQAIICLFVAIMALFPAIAQAMATIRDAETETVIRDCIAPVLAAADFPENALKIIIVNDDELNAFVAGGTNIFINTGLIVEMAHPDMLQGVVAHELGHITGGHLTKMADAVNRATIEQGITTLLSIAAMAAGQGNLGGGMMAAGSQMAMGGLMSFSRSQESAADQAGLTYLNGAHITSEGMFDTLELLRQRERLSPNGQIPYLLSHPLTSDRIGHIRSYGEQHPVKRISDNSPLALRMDRVRAKLKAFLLPPEQVRGTYGHDYSEAGRYAMAILHFRLSELPQALEIMDSLIKQSPKDGYLQEMKGQMQFENGRIKEAIDSYSKAHDLIPDQPLITLGLAQAMLAKPTTELSKNAENLLVRVTEAEPDNSFAWQLMGQARQNLGDTGGAVLAHAEEAFASHRYKDAKRFATEARKSLSDGSPQALRADDILQFASKELENEKSEDKPKGGNRRRR